jgi:hypothetical protein
MYCILILFTVDLIIANNYFRQIARRWLPILSTNSWHRFWITYVFNDYLLYENEFSYRHFKIFLFIKALSDMDYEVRDRHILEVILDIEMWKWTKRPADRTIFYNGKYRLHSNRHWSNKSLNFEIINFIPKSQMYGILLPAFSFMVKKKRWLCSNYFYSL